MKKLLFFLVFAIVLNNNPGFSQAKSECISGDCENGYGVYFWGDDTDWAGDKYYGYWKNGYMHGEGTYYFSSGSIYEGSWVNNKKHGQGTYTWEDGVLYVIHPSRGKACPNEVLGTNYNGLLVVMDGMHMIHLIVSSNFVIFMSIATFKRPSSNVV